MKPLPTWKILLSTLLLLTLEVSAFKKSDNFSAENDIESTAEFNVRKFNCSVVTDVYQKGFSGGSISPDNIGFVGALGDSVSTGYGLFFPRKFSYYGGTFSTGADGNVEDFVTIPNLLEYFNSDLRGGSHGSESHLNFAVSNATCGQLPIQARQFVAELNRQSSKQLDLYWTMIFITIGTDEICYNCSLPNYGALLKAIRYIIKHVKKIFIVVVGPLVISSYEDQDNLVYERCECLRGKTKAEVTTMYKLWEAAFSDIEISFISNDSFALRALPFLKPINKNPVDLLISGHPLLTRLGHEAAAIWLWNELFTPKNGSATAQQQMSSHSIFCPSAECPYFRTPANYETCNTTLLNSLKEGRLKHTTSPHPAVTKRRETLQRHLVLVIVIIIVSAFISVMLFGTIFYRRSLKATKSRFEAVPGV